MVAMAPDSPAHGPAPLRPPAPSTAPGSPAPGPQAPGRLAAPLLAPDEPPPVEVLRPRGACPVLLVCDHASRRIPRALGDLGVVAADLERHIAWDIGAAALTRALADSLDATAVLAGYSRLVLDLNRPLNSPTLMPERSDGTAIPANQGLTAAAREGRLAALFHPYHDTLRRVIERRRAGGQPSLLLSVHSYTPVMAGCPRPWHAGLLWNADRRLAGALIDALSTEPGLVVGENQPYSGQDPEGYTLRMQAEALGLPGCLIEIRQDLIADGTGVAAWTRRLDRVLSDIVTRVMPTWR